MRKICILVCFLMLMLSINSHALTDDATVKWGDETHNYGMNGYPRFATLADGTLLMTADNGRISYSVDNGHTWIKIAKPLTDNAAETVKTKSGKLHSLSRANFQPYVLDDGTVFLGYRSHTRMSDYTKGSEFYTSIRLMTSSDGGKTFGGEQILVEQTTKSGTHGFWEPFFMQIDDDTIACYYADDLNVESITHAQQRICYLTYSISKGEWDKEPKVAIYRSHIKSRDGMPMAAKLIDGSFAMVVEAQDFAKWVSDKYHCVFVVGLSLSKDGRTWSDPVPVYAPAELKSGHVCAAPSIAALRDGRVVITCHSETDSLNPIGAKGEYSRIQNAIISNAPLTADTVLAPVRGAGAAKGFTKLEGVFETVENGYQIWNVAYCSGNNLYLAGTAGYTKDKDENRGGANIAIRHAEVFGTADEAEMFYRVKALVGENAFVTVYADAKGGKVTLTAPAALKSAAPYVYRLADGKITLMDITVKDGEITFFDNGGYYAVTAMTLFGSGDVNADGKTDVLDALCIAKHLGNDACTLADAVAADVNGDEKVDINDVVEIIKGKF